MRLGGEPVLEKPVAKRAADLIVSVPWGTHCCNFYKTKPDLLDILVPYFKKGLLNNEFCLWITAKPLEVRDITKAMRKALPKFDTYLERGHIEIHSDTEWYLKNGVFSPRRILGRWMDKYYQAAASGYDGLRLTANAFQFEKTLWKQFVDYEEELDKTIGKLRIKAVCTYPLDLYLADEVIDVVKNHAYALTKRGRWELIENLQKRRAEERARRKHLAQRERAVQARTADLKLVNETLTTESYCSGAYNPMTDLNRRLPFRGHALHFY